MASVALAKAQLTAKNLPRLDEDERLSPVLTHLATSFLTGLSASEYDGQKDGDGTIVTAEMIDDIARKHFPPCMRHLYERLKGDRHLKHFGRLQLGLFLKVSQSQAGVVGVEWTTRPGRRLDDKWTHTVGLTRLKISTDYEGRRGNGDDCK